MGIFKNSVGRPSKKTLLKRRICVLSILLVFVTSISLLLNLVVSSFYNVDVSSNNKHAKEDHKKIDYNSLVKCFYNDVDLQQQVVLDKDNYIKIPINTEINCSISGDFKGITYSIKSNNTIIRDNVLKYIVDSKGKNYILISFIDNNKRINIKRLFNGLDTIEPSITKACLKNGYIYVTASDNVGINKIAWVKKSLSTNTSDCNKLSKKYITKINDKKSIRNIKVKFRVTTSKDLAACVWDSSGNLVSKTIDKSC